MKTSIIIPARNEEQNLPVLLRSINAQSAKPIDKKSLFVRRGHTPSETDLKERFHGWQVAK